MIIKSINYHLLPNYSKTYTNNIQLIQITYICHGKSSMKTFKLGDIIEFFKKLI